MTWVKGTTTWGNLSADLTKLITGEMADSASVTVAAGDRWVREFAGQDTIRTPASDDVASGDMSNRSGYFTLVGTTTANPVCKVLAPFSSTPAGLVAGRWNVGINIFGANSVSGNYSTATIGVIYSDADNWSVQPTANVYNLNAAGVATLPNGLQISVTSPTGFLVTGGFMNWVRAFSTTYLYGIDWWPTYYRRSGTHTFSVAPSGTVGTDYDVVEQVTDPKNAGDLLYNIGSSVFYARGNLFHGLGIKTATGNSGNLYTLSYPMAAAKCRIFNHPTGNGTLSLDIGQSRLDTVNGSVMRTPNLRLTTWCRCFTTSASVTAASAVQYFMSVTAKGIALVLNGDPGQTGKLGTTYFGTYTPTAPSIDPIPWMAGSSFSDYTGDIAGGDFRTYQPYHTVYFRKVLAGDEGRDWQTGWMRHDLGGTTSGLFGFLHIDVAATSVNLWTPTPTDIYGVRSYIFANLLQPSVMDGKWHLYGFMYSDSNYSIGGQPPVASPYNYTRGTMTNRFLYIPEGGWANGDELNDTVSGTKWMLLKPDYMNIGGRLRSTTNTYWGGIAIAEV
jgi:hypothetical protein